MSQTMRMYQLALAVFTVFFMFLIIGPAVRRYHDSGRSGAWFMVPVVNFILLFKRTDKNSPYAVDHDVNPVITKIGKAAFVVYALVLFGFQVDNALYGKLPDVRIPELEFNGIPENTDVNGNII